MDTQIENLIRLLGSQQEDSISVAMTLLEFNNELQSAFEQHLAQYDWIKPFMSQSDPFKNEKKSCRIVGYFLIQLTLKMPNP